MFRARCVSTRLNKLAAFAVGTALCAAVVAIPKEARADEQAAPVAATRPAPYALSVRGFGGLGAGSGGVGLRYGLAGEGWLTDFVGVGGFYRGMDTAQIFSSQAQDQAVGLSLSARTARRGSYGLLSVGGGYAWGMQTTGLTFFCADSCAPPTSRSVSGATLDVTLGWLFHPGPVEIGPAFALDTSSSGATLTLNLALGFVL